MSLPGLHQAVLDGDLVKIKTLLQTNCDIYELADHPRIKRTGNPLHFAAGEGNIDAAEELLSVAADVNKADDLLQRTPLHWAARTGQEAMITWLIKHGANIHSEASHGWTPLRYAVDYGHVTTAELLIAAGCHVNHKDEYGQIPLHLVAKSGNEKVVQLLLVKGGDVDYQDMHGMTPLHWAASEGHDKVVQLLLDTGAGLNIQDKLGWTPLHKAANNGSEKVVQLLLDGGADPRIEYEDKKMEVNRIISRRIKVYMKNNEYPKSEWLNCLATDSAQGLSQLIDKGFDVNANVWYQNSWKPGVVIAAIKGHVNVLQILLTAGCNTNAHDVEKKTALMHAATQGHEDVVQSLIDGICNINLKCNKGLTALMYAVAGGHINITRLLVNAKCDINCHDKQGRIALTIAADSGYENIVEHLIQADNETTLAQTSKAGQNIIEKILMNKYKNTCTTLFYAARYGKSNMIKSIMNGHVFDINKAAVHDGKTALMFACKHGHHDVVNILLDTGMCDVSIKSKNGKTAMDYARNAGHINIYQQMKKSKSITKTPSDPKSTKVRPLFEIPKSASVSVLSDALSPWQPLSSKYQSINDYGSSESVNISLNSFTSIDTMLTIDNFPITRPHTLSTSSLPTMASSIATVDHVTRILANPLVKPPTEHAEQHEKTTSLHVDAVAEIPLDTATDPSPSIPTVSYSAVGTAASQVPVLQEDNLVARREPSLTPTIDQSYPMRRPLGVAVIINNHHFNVGECKERGGTQYDGENLTRSLHNCGYIVHMYNDLSARNILGCLDHYSQFDHTRFSSFFCCVMSHGCYGNIIGVDGEKVPIIKLTSLFTSEKCSTLKDKPKAFIMVCCQTNTGDLGRLPHEELLIPLQEAHFIVAYSTLPGLYSYRDEYMGTPYIKALTENIDKYFEARCLTEILRNTNKYMSRKYGTTRVGGRQIQMFAMPFHSLSTRFVMYAPPSQDQCTEHVGVPWFTVPNDHVPEELGFCMEGMRVVGETEGGRSVEMATNSVN